MAENGMKNDESASAINIGESSEWSWPLQIFAAYAFTQSQNNMDPVLAGITLGTFVKVVELARHNKDSIDKMRKSRRPAEPAPLLICVKAYLHPGGLRYHTEKGFCVTKNGDPCSTSLAHEHLVHVLVSIGSAGVTTSEALRPVVASPPVKVPHSVGGLCARLRASRLVLYRARCLTNYPTTVVPFARSSFGVLPSASALIGFLFFVRLKEGYS
ncbi:hypothetical protein B0H14DRAFT_3865277 [Mycena olivaceomarginata]|nr:hypothetical protein B0H14DRAFT_3865277 [Mycena olivaceomarginata]